jgi:hypothetical protein
MNTATRPIILTDIGVEIVSVDTVFVHQSALHFVKVEVTDTYTINMPDIKSKTRDYDMNYLEPLDWHELVSISLPDPIYFQAKGPYRYKLLLQNYDIHIPNSTILRMWIQTDQGQEYSHEIYLVHLMP